MLLCCFHFSFLYLTVYVCFFFPASDATAIVWKTRSASAHFERRKEMRWCDIRLDLLPVASESESGIGKHVSYGTIVADAAATKGPGPAGRLMASNKKQDRKRKKKSLLYLLTILKLCNIVYIFSGYGTHGSPTLTSLSCKFRLGRFLERETEREREHGSER